MHVGVSLNANLICEDWMKQCRDAGIYCIEVSCSHLDNFDKIDFDFINHLAKKYGIVLWSYHLTFFPFDKIDISSADPVVRDFSIEILKKQIVASSKIGIKKFIIHPGAEPYKDEEREERIATAAQSLKILSAVAQDCGGVLCVENLPRTCLSRSSDDMLKLISLDDNLKVCFDTNHLLIEDPCLFIQKLGSRIVTTHVSDYDFINERHWLPGEGKLDFYKVYQALLDVGYQGVWLYEVSPFKSATETIQRTKPLDLFDFAQNAKEIFDNKPLTVYGTPTI